MSDEKRPITSKYLQALVDQHIEYETVLHYIHLPHIPVPKTEISNKPEAAKISVSDVKRYTDAFLEVFKWLKWATLPEDGNQGERRVYKVFKVIVDDFGYVSHSESSIVASLKGLDIKELDWRRPDIGSETIFEGAPIVSILHLYWNGNRGVLQGWCCPDGLCKLGDVSSLTAYLT